GCCFLKPLKRLSAAGLHRQYNQRANKTAPYGILDIAGRDHKGNFTNASSTSSIARKLMNAAQSHGQLLRIYEIDSVQQALRSLFQARHRYGQKLTFFWGLGHSDGVS